MPPIELFSQELSFSSREMVWKADVHRRIRFAHSYQKNVDLTFDVKRIAVKPKDREALECR